MKKHFIFVWTFILVTGFQGVHAYFFESEILEKGFIQKINSSLTFFNKNLWTPMSKSGMVQIDNKGKYRTFRDAKTKLEDKEISALVSNSHYLFMGTSEGLYQMSYSENLKFYPWNYLETPRKLFIDEGNNFWIVFSEKLVKGYFFNDKMQFQEILINGKSVAGIKDVAVDRMGSVWLASPEGLVEYNIWKNKNYTFKEGIGEVTEIEVDENQNIWFISKNHFSSNLMKYNGLEVKKITEIERFQWEDLSSLFIDEQGIIWIGCNRGLMRGFRERYSWYGKEEGVPPGKIENIFQTAGRLFLKSHNKDGVFLGMMKTSIE